MSPRSAWRKWDVPGSAVGEIRGRKYFFSAISPPVSPADVLDLAVGAVRQLPPFRTLRVPASIQDAVRAGGESVPGSWAVQLPPVAHRSFPDSLAVTAHAEYKGLPGGSASLECIAQDGGEASCVYLFFNDSAGWAAPVSEGLVAVTLFAISRRLHDAMGLPLDGGWSCHEGDWTMSRMVLIEGLEVAIALGPARLEMLE